MDKLELYHFHEKNHNDRFWEENKEIKVPNTFKSEMYKNYMKFSTGVPIEGINEKILYELLIEGYVKEIKNGNLSVIDDIVINSLLISTRATLFKRETALENYRKEKNSSLPSRLHCMYFTDEQGIDYFKEALGKKELELFRVEVVGNIFKTNEQFLPNETLSYEETYNNAYNYWNPNFKKAPDNSNEYLVQGKVKILEKIL